MRRLLTIIYIVFCSELGVFLFILPWVSIWRRNYFIDHYPLISAISHNYFIRGAVSGVGLADIWMAIFELCRFLHHPRALDSRPTR